jgi:hypothetical protein
MNADQPAAAVPTLPRVLGYLRPQSSASASTS